MEEKNFAEMMEEIAKTAVFPEANREEKGTRINMTPEKIPAFAQLVDRETLENSIGVFLSNMVMKFYGVDITMDCEEIPIVQRAEAGDIQARRILGMVAAIAEGISYDIKGMEWDFED